MVVEAAPLPYWMPNIQKVGKEMKVREGIELECTNYTAPTGFTIDINDGYGEASLHMDFCCGNYDAKVLKPIMKTFVERYSNSFKPMTIKYTGLQIHDIDMDTLVPTVHYEDINDHACASMYNTGMEDFIEKVLYGLPLRYCLFDMFQDCADWLEDDYDESDADTMLRSAIFPMNVDEELEEKWVENHTKPWSFQERRILKVQHEGIGLYINANCLKEEEIAAIKERTDCEEIVVEKA